MEKWRLGLDLGTNSIGWAALALDENNEITGNIIDMGVRIFSDGREPKTGTPLNEARRMARGTRRNLMRRRQRRKHLFVLLQKEGLFPTTKEEASQMKLLNPYELRVKALDEKLSPYELGRTLFHLGVRRGFKSNRKDNQDEAIVRDIEDSDKQKEVTLDPEKMKQGEKCLHLEKAIKESGYRTLGEFLWKEQKKNCGIRFVSERTKYYPTRKLYEAEFEAIREKQKPFYQNVNWDEIHKAIFFQRPLKPQERGRCQFMPDKERTFKAMPCSHRYRILQEVYNLEIAGSLRVSKIAAVANAALFEDDELALPNTLTQEHRDKLIQLLDNKNELSFDKIRKELGFDESVKFNLETDARTKLNGNTTSVKMRGEKYFGKKWDDFSLSEQDEIVEKLITANEDSEVEEMLAKYEWLSSEQKNKIIRATFSSGTTSFCKELTEKLVAEMSEKHLQYDKALLLLGYDHSDDKIENHYDSLPYYGKVLTGSTMDMNASESEDHPEKKYGKIANPTVHVALNQLRVVVNALIKRYGKPAQIVVELSRDLKASREAKDAMQKANKKRADDNKRLNKNISDMSGIQYPNRQDRLKYRLWEELGAESMSRRCIYCGENISASELFTKNIEIEHILPYSRTLLDSESNKTLAHAHCNAKKGEHTPFEAFGAETSGQYAWAGIMKRADALKSCQKKKRFTEKAIDEFEKDNKFIERQLTDNAYLSKIARRYLTCITEKPSDVWTVAGGATKLMRDKWEIDQILKRQITEKEVVSLGLKDEEIGTFKKNRYDHRHHALDAVVIAQTDRSMVKKIADANAHHQKNRIEMPEMKILRTDLIDCIKNIVPSFKPDHGAEGKLSKETLLGHIKQEQAVKISELQQDDIMNIKVDAVRQEFEKAIAEKGDFKKAVKSLSDKYPSVKVFRYMFVCRSPITSLTEKNISDIVDEKIKQKLIEFRDEHSGEKWENILLEFSKTTGIKKVRCKNFVQSPIVIHENSTNPRKPVRYVAPEDYFAVIIWQLPPAKEGASPKYEGQFVRRIKPDFVDNKGKAIPQKPHPAAKNICTLHKDDYLEISDGKNWKIVRVRGLQAAANKLDIRPIWATDDARTWLIATSQKMIESGWKPQKGQNFISINVLFGEKSAHKITVDPLGKVYRKKL